MSKVKDKKLTNNLNGYRLVFAQYKISLKFGEIKFNKKKFHRSKQPIYLNQVEISKIAISDQFKLDDGVKNFIGYKNGETVKLLCIILPQMSDIIKYFKNKEKPCHFS